MSELEDLAHPAPGLYEQLITLRFEEKLKELSRLGWRPVSDAVGPESVPHVLARHVSHTVRRVLQNLPADDRVHAANHILESISTLKGAQEWVDLVADGPRQLLAVTRQEAPGVFAMRPGVPLSDTALLTNSPEDPSLGFELRAELATADRVDLLCAFVKWHGLRVIERSLQAARERSVPIRVLTTTYMGATERRALDRLVEDFDAEVKVNYETRSTRLHAKAWLFQRNSGYHTAYVGSSNLSKAALLDGLELAPDHFDVIVIDEFHHGTSPTYRKIVDHFQPMELLGLTATPERMDGRNIQDEFFDGRIAAEMRLWEALDNNLLCPFHYFGISDNTDLSAVEWKRGAYDVSSLSNVLTGNTVRAGLVVKAVEEKVADPGRMRALGFCVSVAHAHFMAESFRSAGFNAVAVSGETPADQRRQALEDLRSGKVQVVFSVDLFNEGVDVPDVDTLLLLRPTSSATVFLQQLGRGLRRSDTKAVLTVLDFIGQHRKEFRFENQFRALTNLTRKRLLDHIEHDFPQLPSGCEIMLEEKAKHTIIANIKDQLSVNVTTLAREVAAYAEPRLSRYLEESGREIKELYRGNGNSWTGLLRRAGLMDREAPEGEAALLRRVPAFLHVDDPLRVAAYTRMLEDEAPAYRDLDEQGKAYARMLFFQLWPLGGVTRKGFAHYDAGFAALRKQHAFRSELRQVLAYNLAHTEHVPIPLLGASGDRGVPLAVHASYTREEILPALGQSDIGGFMPGDFREGVKWCESVKTDALLVTLEKDEKDFSPQTRYRDFALSETRFHWESQNQTSETSATGLRYQHHVAQDSQVLLFVRRYKTTDIGGAQPWMLLGPAEYEKHEGSKPMAITWKVKYPIPADVLSYAKAVAAG
ncbi:DUF3427 domain-containing protein [Streptomyces viridosporus]